MAVQINYRLLLIGCLIFFVSHFWDGRAVRAKEIEATHEWQLVEEGDSIPAGLHVRMDLESGKKWAKLMDEDETDAHVTTLATTKTESDKEDEAVKGKQKDVKITHLSDAEVQATGTTKVSAGLGTNLDEATRKRNFASTVASLNDHISEDEDETDIVLVDGYNYKMMHRTFASLPLDEQERMGGIPQLPDVETATIEEIKNFKERMLEIWLKRQAELKQVEDELVVDLPKIIQERIDFLKNYLENPDIHLHQLLLSKNKEDDYSSSFSDDQSNENDGDKINDILSVLYDLEYHLADLDMARDFHIMGGWPLLVSILSDSVHSSNSSSKNETEFIPQHVLDKIPSLIWEIQSAAAWSIGTAVKNAEEFHLWALEDFSDALVSSPVLVEYDGQKHPITVISLLLSSSFLPGSELSNHLHPSYLKKKQKSLYALASLLRGNRRALRHFYIVDGPSILIKDMFGAISSDSENDQVPSKNIKFASKVLALACDLITDIIVHPDGGDYGSKAEIADIDEDIVTSFTTKEWCDSAKRLLNVAANGSSFSMQENILRSVSVVAPYCKYDTKDLAMANKLKDMWKNDESIDESYRDELFDLVNKILGLK